MLRMNWLKTKIKLKYVWFYILGILTILAILCVSWLNDRIYEVIITIIGFYLLRPLYNKQCHASNLYKCSIISIIVFIVVTILELPKATSILTALILSITLTLFSYYFRDYFDLKDILKAKKLKVTKGISKENLNKIIENTNLTETQKQILQYYYCNKMSITKISYLIHYSYDYIVELKRKALKELAKN